VNQVIRREILVLIKPIQTSPAVKMAKAPVTKTIAASPDPK
jgi:hypothetical protein